MLVLVTGANGFIGKNLIVHLREKGIESAGITGFNSLEFEGIKKEAGVRRWR